jgi:hypothetical protein
MKRLMLALAAAILCAVAPPAADAQDAEAKYQALLAAAKADPAAADWQALRFAYADRRPSRRFRTTRAARRSKRQ